MRGTSRATAALSAFLLSLAAAHAAATEVLFDPHDRARTIFPSDAFTVADFSQNTFRRVSLAKPNCADNQTRCDDVDVLNTLDGFNPQPRISIPFSGPIDVSTVSSDSIFLVSLGSTIGRGATAGRGSVVGDKIGINQAVWEPTTNTLYVESDKFLDQHTRYAVVVTNLVKDAAGKSIQDRRGPLGAEITEDVLQVLLNAGRRHGDRVKIVAASVFTTMSVSADLEKIQRQVAAATPGPVDFNVVQGGGRAYFPASTLLGLTLNRQVSTAPAFSPQPLPIPLLFNILGPGVVGALAFGKFSSPNYLLPDVTLPSLSSRTGRPVPQSMNDVHFNVALPAGAKPAAGYPVAIFGHGFTDNKLGAFSTLVATMAKAGIATIGINVVGHGFGPLTTVTVSTAGGTFTVAGGGRGIDQNGDGAIGSTEGSSSSGPRVLIGSSDALRQTTIDLMQLVRQIQAGIDVDGDGSPDLDSSRIYYFGQSFGGIYGTIFLGAEPSVRVGVPNVGGGPIVDIIRLSPVFRPLFDAAVAARGFGELGPEFDENLPLRNEPVRVNTVEGAIDLQDLTDQIEWGNQRGSPVAYAPYVRKAPLRRNPPKNVIVQFGKGDQTVPNPTETALVRAGELDDRVTYYRNDLAFAAGSPVKNPHTFLTNVGVPGLAALNALQAQGQIATFFASDGALTIDPDGAGPLFETPIVPPLPETLNFIP